jgi:inner membrane protein
MLILAHTGITLGAATVVAGVVKHRRSSKGGLTSWFTALAGYLDIRVLIIGSMLPDIIDKPLGLYFFAGSLGSGRIYTHTLLFLILIILAGLLLYRLKHTTWMLVLAAGTLAHLLLDEMWKFPKTLLWPVMGLEFEKSDVAGWFDNIWNALSTKPDVYVPEAIGFVILVWFGLTLIFRKKIGDFIMRGRVQ